ncbi:MAG TPA: hypothetical protein VL404_03970 [Candidatus Eisenbacteria bacterium]|jgi:hypothetical protein|nr:hypothetical protein [Candidatus Eisenbacteria bacterium]
MIEINLLPEELRRKDKFKIVLPDLPIGKTIVALFAFFFIAQMGLLIFAFYERGRVIELKKEITVLTDETRDLARKKADIVAMRSRLKEIDALTSRDVYWSKLLNAVSDSMTKGTWLTGFSLLETQESSGPPPAPGKPAPRGRRIRQIRLEGSVVGQGQETAFIGKFIKEIKSNAFLNALFDDVKLANITQKKIREFDVYDFVLICVFKDVPAPAGAAK